MESTFTTRRSVLFFCSALSLVAGGLIGFFTPHPHGQSLVVITPDPTATALPSPTPAPLRVYVCGAVNSPAVYRLPPGSLADDAIRAAGGPAPEADLERINLALELQDQQQVYVPRVGEEYSRPAISGGAEIAAEPVININTATVAELEMLPHIGLATAQRIVEYREMYGPFLSSADLLQVPGIGPATLEKIQDRLVTD